jgi:hypothetical protein
MMKLLTPANVFKSVLGSIVIMSAVVAKEFDSAAQSLNAATGAAGKLDSMIGMLGQNATTNMGIGMQEQSEALIALSTNMTSFSRTGEDAQVSMRNTTAELAKLGVSADSTAKTFNSLVNGFGMSAKQAENVQKDIAKTAMAIGKPVSQMAEEFAGSLPYLSRFGKEAPQIFKKVAAAARGLNVETQTLIDMTTQMDTFEGAAQSAGQLNALLGGPMLNSYELLNASTEERIRLVLGAVDASGKSFASMNQFEKQALATAAGISDIGEATKLFEGGLSGYNEGLERAAEGAVAQQNLNEAIQKATSAFDKFMMVGKSFGILFYPIFLLVELFAKGFLGLNDILGGLLPLVIVGILLLFKKVRQALVSMVKGMWHMIKTTWKFMRGTKDLNVFLKEQGGILEALTNKYEKLAKAKKKAGAADPGGESSAERGLKDAVEEEGAGGGGEDSLGEQLVDSALEADPMAAGESILDSLKDKAKDKISGFAKKRGGFFGRLFGAEAEEAEPEPPTDPVSSVTSAIEDTGTASTAAAAPTRTFGEALKGILESATKNAKGLLALSVAMLAIGGAVWLAATGMAAFVSAFEGFDAAQILAISVALLVFGLTLAALAFIAIKAAAVGAPLALLAFGAAFLLIGAGVALAAYGLSLIVESLKGLPTDNILGFVGALYALIPALVLLGVTGIVLGAPLLIMSRILLGLGAAMFLMGTGAALLAASFTALNPEMISSLVDALNGFSEIDAISLGVKFYLISSGIDELAEALETIPVDESKAFSEVVSKLVEYSAVMEKAPAGMENVKEMVAIAAEYQMVQAETRIPLLDSFLGILEKGVSAVAGAAGGTPAGGKDIVLVLNNREVGRAIDVHLDNKIKDDIKIG